ncbi:MAG: hypothetical protein U9N14_02470 [Pseudomonadota bacterium]|nr:hypothetical protein [Pseudomonadota bacterium]
MNVMINRTSLWIMLLLMLATLVSIWVRWEQIDPGSLQLRFENRFWNEEVTGHTAMILLSYDQAFRYGLPHTLLPSDPFTRDEIAQGHVTPVESDGIAWSAFRPDRNGAQVYLSFPPPPFLGMFALLKAVGAPVNVISVRLLGAVLQGLTAIFMALFVWSATKRMTKLAPRAAGALVAGSAYLFSTETWHSSVAGVWAHHIAQPVFILFAMAFAFKAPGRWRPILLAVLACLSASFEWSGYMLAFGFFVGALLLAWRERNKAHLVDAGAIALGVMLALITMIAHYAWAIGVDVWLNQLFARFDKRSQNLITYEQLKMMLWISANGWILLPLVLLPLMVAWRVRLNISGPVLVAIGALGFACLELAIMTNHAFHYSFDAFKLVSFLGIVSGLMVAFLFMRYGKYGRLLVVALVLGAIAWNADIWQNVYDEPRRPEDGAVARTAKEIAATLEDDRLLFLVTQDPVHLAKFVQGWIGEGLHFVPDTAAARAKLRQACWTQGTVYHVDLTAGNIVRKENIYAPPCSAPE